MIQRCALLVIGPSEDDDAHASLLALKSVCERLRVPVYAETDAAGPAVLERLRATGRRRLFLAGSNQNQRLCRAALGASAQGFDVLVANDTCDDPELNICETAHTTSVDRVIECLHIAARLEAAEQHGLALLRRIEQADIIVPGRTEREMSRDILALAGTHEPSVEHFWHKRIVRVGDNTVETYRANPPDARLAHDDIAFVDLGPVLDDIEADLGRAYVFGDDPDKMRMTSDLEPIFKACQARYWQQPHMSGAELYACMVQACEARGWKPGHSHCGHLVGPFPHELRQRCQPNNYIAADNHMSMSAPAPDGELRHWILEVHLVHPRRTFGAFFEQLL